jgi:hypothetical protein
VANDPTSNGSLTLTGGLALAACPPTDPTNCNTLPLEAFNRTQGRGIPYGTDFSRWLMKINTKLNSKDQMSFRYLVDRTIDPGAPASLPGQEIGTLAFNQSFTINGVYVISSKWINEARSLS